MFSFFTCYCFWKPKARSGHQGSSSSIFFRDEFVPREIKPITQNKADTQQRKVDYEAFQSRGLPLAQPMLSSFPKLNVHVFLWLFNLKTNKPEGLFSLYKWKWKKASFSVTEQPSWSNRTLAASRALPTCSPSHHPSKETPPDSVTIGVYWLFFSLCKAGIMWGKNKNSELENLIIRQNLYWACSWLFVQAPCPLSNACPYALWNVRQTSWKNLRCVPVKSIWNFEDIVFFNECFYRDGMSDSHICNFRWRSLSVASSMRPCIFMPVLIYIPSCFQKDLWLYNTHRRPGFRQVFLSDLDKASAAFGP